MRLEEYIKLTNETTVTSDVAIPDNPPVSGSYIKQRILKKKRKRKGLDIFK